MALISNILVVTVFLALGAFSLSTMIAVIHTSYEQWIKVKPDSVVAGLPEEEGRKQYNIAVVITVILGSIITGLCLNIIIGVFQ